MAQIGTILTTLGEYPYPVENAVLLKNARKIFLDYALVQSDMSPQDHKKYFHWLSDFETRLDALLRSQGRKPQIPLCGGDRLAYFLYQVTVPRQYNDPAIKQKIYTLTPFIFTRLRMHLEQEKRSGHKTTISDDLPNQLAILIHFFPASKILNGSVWDGSIRLDDIRKAMESYGQTDTGAAETETLERYTRQIADLLKINPKNEANEIEIDDPSLRKKFKVSDSKRILLLNINEQNTELDDELVAFVETDDNFEHPLENSYKVKFGNLRSESGDRRAIYHSSIHDVRVLSHGEIIWLSEIMDKTLENPNFVTLSLLLWLSLITGLPVKRILNLRYAAAESFESIILGENASTDGFTEESPLFLFAQAGLVLSKTTAALSPFSESSTSFTMPGYRERSDLIPLDIGCRGIRYALAARQSRQSNTSQFVFPNPTDPSKPMTLDHLHKVMFILNEKKTVLQRLPITWARLAATARPYSEKVEGGTQLIYALSSGRPQQAEQTRLHYIAYNCGQFFQDHGQVVRLFESMIKKVPENPEKSNIEQLAVKLENTLPGLEAYFRKNLGGAYVPRSGLVPRTWQNICREQLDSAASDNVQQQLNLSSLRAVFATMMYTGVREQEIREVKLSKLDLHAGILRITGKSNKYFQDGRELPLTETAIHELENYLKVKSKLSCQSPYLFTFMDNNEQHQQLPPGRIDWLMTHSPIPSNEIMFSLRTLRHALRTSLHEIKADYNFANEFFGHVVSQTTCTHHLSGIFYNKAQDSFRKSVNEAVAKCLN